MVEIEYVITDELGIHARPAGLLVKAVKDYESDVKVGTPANMVDAKRIMGVMRLTLKHGDKLTMTFEGPDEERAAKETAEFLKANL